MFHLFLFLLLHNFHLLVYQILFLIHHHYYHQKYQYQLSGGEQQRVSIARAVVKKPKIMFCDEPTGALDEENAKEILGVIQTLNETFKTTVVLITHNPSIGVMADRIVKLNSGEVVDIIVNKNKKRASEIVWG